MTIYKYFPGYREAKQKVEGQPMADDLSLIDALYGRENLKFGDGEAAVKQEALRQLEIEFREAVNEAATFFVNVAKGGL